MMKKTTTLCLLTCLFILLVASNPTSAHDELRNPKEGYEGPYTVINITRFGSGYIQLTLQVNNEFYILSYRDSFPRFLIEDRLKIKFRYDNGWSAEIFNMDAPDREKVWV